jgi:hypothetical protein
MFSITNLFIKKTLIAFYQEENIFYTQKITIKNNKIIQKEEQSFEDEDEFLQFIKSSLIENTQTYISTIITTYNQGCMDSCSHTRYKELNINIENIKILCINNKFSVFIGLFELQEFKKEMSKYSVDLIYSPYLIIEKNKKETKNTLYALITKKNVILSIYKKEIPLYSAIYEFKEENETEEAQIENSEDLFNDDIPIDDIEEIYDLDDLNELDDDIEENNLDDLEDNIENDNEEEENTQTINNIKEETEIINFIKNSIKDYYENYSDDFLENIYLLKGYEFDTKFLKDIEDELFLEIKTEDINILNNINLLARKDLDV